MSNIFGIWQMDGAVLGSDEIANLTRPTCQYAPDGSFSKIAGSIAVGVQPYYTNERAKLDTGPTYAFNGDLVTLDGRIDNHRELCTMLGISEKDNTSDSEIVLRAFEHWGSGCFAKFIGDWALALWMPRDRTLFLARDHAGTRTLFYHHTKGVVIWSTHLDSFFYGHQRNYKLSVAYMGGYLAGISCGDSTPYEGIRSVLPGHVVTINADRQTTTPYWQPVVVDRIRYNRDTDYEDHFRSLFQQAVRRRIDAGAPILAHLSGGIDSSSIVCMADCLYQSEEDGRLQRLDTVSYFDDSEPSWNERPFVSMVEEQRGKTGFHLDHSFIEHQFESSDVSKRSFVPGRDLASDLREETFERLPQASRYRVILSGVGGDELLGGVPTPLPELGDLLVSGQMLGFLERSAAWGIASRTSLWHLIGQTSHYLWSLSHHQEHSMGHFPAWGTNHLRALCQTISPITGHSSLPFLPSALESASGWYAVLGAIAQTPPPSIIRREYRYPYLDRDLVEFLLCVPREQLVRPGRRRYMMRNALKGIVPSGVLERRRKAFITRSPLLALQSARERIFTLFKKSILAGMQLIDTPKFLHLIDLASTGEDLPQLAGISRAILLELWLQSAGSLQAETATSSLASCLTTSS